MADDVRDDHSTTESEAESVGIARSLSAARHEYLATSREAAEQILTANLVKATHAALSVQQHPGLSSRFSPLSAAGRAAPPVHLHNIMQGISRTVLAEELPFVQPMPPFKAWDYLVSNELAQGVGRQMYYTDEIGETIPLSDSDEEVDSDTESLDGVSREADMHLLKTALAQYGNRHDVVRIAAGMLKVKKASVQARMQFLAAAAPTAAAACPDDQKLDVMVGDFTRTFCRRCKVFNCFTHTGPHTKPQQRRPGATAAPTTVPCGSQCFKAASSSNAVADGLPALEAITNQQVKEASAAMEPAALLLNNYAEEAGLSDEADVKQEDSADNPKLLPMGAAAGHGGSSRAGGHSPSSAANHRSSKQNYPAGPRAAACHSPRGTHFANHPVQVERVDRTHAATPQESSRKRRRGQASVLGEAMTAARDASAAAYAAFPLAAHHLFAPPENSAQPDLKQPQQEKPVQEHSLVTRNHTHTRSTGASIPDISPLSSELIVISDSEEERSDSAPNTNPKPPRPAQTYSLTSKHYLGPSRTPVPTPRDRGTPASGYKAIPDGSADSPFVIEITDSDDDRPPQTNGHVMTPVGSVKADPSARAQHQPSRQSKAGSSRQSEGKACPLELLHVPEAVPFSLGTEGRTSASPQGAPTHRMPPESHTPESNLPPVTACVQASPTSSHTVAQAAEKEVVQEHIRQAACRSALLAVAWPCRRASGSGASSDATTISAGDSKEAVAEQSQKAESDADHPDMGWTLFEVSVFDKAAEMYSGDSCKMARLVGTKSCLEVHAHLLKVGLPAALAGAATLTAAPVGRGRWRKSGPSKRKMKYAGQAKHVVLKRLRKGKAKGAQETPPYQPCQCKGGCKEGCPCSAEGHFCEKFCACGPDCQSRFKGCVCKGGCRTRACPCLASDRECDPDLCKPCQWSICSERPAGSVDCQNMKLRLRQHKRVAMGLSHVAGWGAFAQEDIKRNEFVAEYTGELINHKEADRRGKAYDRDSNTYLFDLNDDWVIDAKHRGNKMRFANHSDQPNCRVQIKMVDGDHRVAIYAAQDIPTGTELLYNYGNRFGKV